MLQDGYGNIVHSNMPFYSVTSSAKFLNALKQFISVVKRCLYSLQTGEANLKSLAPPGGRTGQPHYLYRDLSSQ